MVAGFKLQSAPCSGTKQQHGPTCAADIFLPWLDFTLSMVGMAFKHLQRRNGTVLFG